MKVARSLETLGNQKTTWRNNPENNNLNSHRPENLKPYYRPTYGLSI
jgi:hypothetical protein